MKPKKFSSATTLIRKLNAQCAGRSFAFFYITNACNLCCVHCSFQSAPDKQDSFMDTDMLLRTIDEMRGIHDITLTGGEPLLHPGFEKVLAQASRNATIVYLMTNGINLITKKLLLALAKKRDLAGLKTALKEAMAGFPQNLHLFFPLDSFHLEAFRPFGFLLAGLAEVAQEWHLIPQRPLLGFLSNEVSPQKSEALMSTFNVRSFCHVGTAAFSPWRRAKNIRRWYAAYALNQNPFPGGIYINFKGVYLNEAALLMDLREGLTTPLKIGVLDPTYRSKRQLHEIVKQATAGSKRL